MVEYRHKNYVENRNKLKAHITKENIKRINKKILLTQYVIPWIFEDVSNDYDPTKGNNIKHYLDLSSSQRETLLFPRKDLHELSEDQEVEYISLLLDGVFNGTITSLEDRNELLKRIKENHVEPAFTKYEYNHAHIENTIRSSDRKSTVISKLTNLIDHTFRYDIGHAGKRNKYFPEFTHLDGDAYLENINNVIHRPDWRVRLISLVDSYFYEDHEYNASQPFTVSYNQYYLDKRAKSPRVLRVTYANHPRYIVDYNNAQDISFFMDKELLIDDSLSVACEPETKKSVGKIPYLSCGTRLRVGNMISNKDRVDIDVVTDINIADNEIKISSLSMNTRYKDVVVDDKEISNFDLIYDDISQYVNEPELTNKLIGFLADNIVEKCHVKVENEELPVKVKTIKSKSIQTYNHRLISTHNITEIIPIKAVDSEQNNLRTYKNYVDSRHRIVTVSKTLNDNYVEVMCNQVPNHASNVYYKLNPVHLTPVSSMANINTPFMSTETNFFKEGLYITHDSNIPVYFTKYEESEYDQLLLVSNGGLYHPSVIKEPYVEPGDFQSEWFKNNT